MKKREPLGSPWRTKEESSLFLGTVLRIVGWFERPLRAAGVDWPIFRELLRTRIVMDLRPAESSGSGMAVVGTMVSVLVAWALGLMTGLVSILGSSATWVITSTSALCFVLALILLQSLASMLMDPTDVRVLARHPVPDRTLFAVRLVQVFAYLSIQSLGFLGGNLMLAWIKNPAVPVLTVYPLLALAATLTVLGAVTLLVTGLLRLVGPGQFQRVVLWMQVVVGGAVAASVQIAPRLIGRERLQELWESDSAWKVLWPPFAYAQLFEAAAGRGATSFGAFAVAVLVPLVGLLLTLRLASRHYVAGLESSAEASVSRVARWPGGLGPWLARCLTRGREQCVGFAFAWALGRREGHVLRIVLPQLLSMQAMAFGIMLKDDDQAFFLCMSAAMLLFVVPNVLEQGQATPTPEARWLFLASPLEDERELMRGGLKGLLVSWGAISMALAAALQLAILGLERLPEILLAFELAAALGLFYARLWAFGVPFRRAIRANQMANMGLVLSMMLAMFALGAAHFGLTYWWPAELVALVLLPFLLWRQWRALDRKEIGPEHRLVARTKLEPE
jgi:hypothetical protein